MGWYDGMDSEFSRRLQSLITASAGRVGVGSGYRSVEEQAALWNDAVRTYGSEDAARNYVAPPGSSNHNHGVAADLWYADDNAIEWAHANASRYGLLFPMSWENWHIEPIGVRDGTYKSTVPVEGYTPGDPDSYTNTPAGSVSPMDPKQRFDLGYQLTSLNDMLSGSMDGNSVLAGPNSDILKGPDSSMLGTVPTDIAAASTEIVDRTMR